jgi:hypothetical protein
VLLLDLLGRLSKQTGSNAARELADIVFSKKDSADEWAIALRNTAWSDPKAADFVTEKFREMVRYEPWRKQPSRGFLEAFDVVVYTKNVGFVSELASLLEEQNDLVPRASGVTLDRLAEQAPTEVMAHLNQNPTVLANRPKLRADYYTKANFSDGTQRQLVETYLSRPDVTDREKQKYLGGLASPGTFVSDNLLTAPAPADDPPEKVTALRETIQTWLTTNRFPTLGPALQVLNSRLAEVP